MTLQPIPAAGRRLRVAVLMGGTSSEREISLVTGRMIVQALDKSKYEVLALDTRELLSLSGSPAYLAAAPAPAASGASPVNAPAPVIIGQGGAPTQNGPADRGGQRPDVVFIALHGKGGEDGTVQGMLELLGLPYTGSGVLASALAMDKVMSKRLFQAAGIPVVDGIFIHRKTLQSWTEADFNRAALAEVQAHLGFPVFVKPNAGGSTCGCTLVTSSGGLYAAVQEALKFDDTALVEKYVRGTEITVGVLDFPGEPLKPLPIIEIVPKSEYYDYESKYAEGGSEHIIPARLSEELTRRAQEIALQCHTLLGCRGMSRTDMIVTGDQLSVLEVNTIPGMTPTSLLPQAAGHAGIPFPELVEKIIQSAIQP